MEHVAIMKKSWGLLPKILSGSKTIESRWLMNRSAPWGKVSRGDTVYFKNSGEPVTAKATVGDVLQFDGLTPCRVHDILEQYGEDDGITSSRLEHYEALFQNKRYCVLVFLEGVQAVQPFDIDKRGFGAMAAWMVAPSISRLAR